MLGKRRARPGLNWAAVGPVGPVGRVGLVVDEEDCSELPIAGLAKYPIYSIMYFIFYTH